MILRTHTRFWCIIYTILLGKLKEKCNPLYHLCPIIIYLRPILAQVIAKKNFFGQNVGIICKCYSRNMGALWTLNSKTFLKFERNTYMYI